MTDCMRSRSKRRPDARLHQWTLGHGRGAQRHYSAPDRRTLLLLLRAHAYIHVQSPSQTRSLYCVAQAFGISTAAVHGSMAITQLLNTTATITSAAQCQALVRAIHPEANAAEYSNTGFTACQAVFNACVSLATLKSSTCS
jgi:hypothetical protein